MHHPDRREIMNKLIKEAAYKSVMKILHEFGGEKITMDEVALQAGVSKGTLYNYFKNKDELMSFVRNQTIQPVIDRFREIREQKTTAKEKLKATLSFSFQMFYSNKDFLRYQHSTISYKQKMELSRRIACEHFEVIWEQGINSGEFDVEDSFVFRACTAGAIAYLLDDWTMNEINLSDTDQLTEKFMHIMETGFIRSKK